MSDEQVTPGETVLSSGGDQIFPKGFPVGTVMKVSPGKELFLNIKVHAAADLSRLEEVLVMTDKQERQVVAEGAGTVRAADILAQRLPSVPDKPATVAAAPGTAPGKPVGAATESGLTAAAKPVTNGVNKPLAGAGTGTKLAQRPAARLAPASTTAESPVIKPADSGVGNGSANAGASNGATSKASSPSTPEKSSEKPAVPANPSIPQSNPQPATEDNPN
jgi:rod shape-determining protein MreC